MQLIIFKFRKFFFLFCWNTTYYQYHHTIVPTLKTIQNILECFLSDIKMHCITLWPIFIKLKQVIKNCVHSKCTEFLSSTKVIWIKLLKINCRPFTSSVLTWCPSSFNLQAYVGKKWKKGAMHNYLKG